MWQSEVAALALDRELREVGLATTLGLAAALWPDGPAPPPPHPLTDEPPGPMRRRGPRPLARHLAPAAMLMSGRGATPASPGAPPEPAFPVSPADVGLLAGIAAYRRHPYRRDLPDPPCVWSEGDTRLLDHSAGVGGDFKADADASVPVMFVPSLINRAQVLDLMPGRSMLRWLAGQGLRPLLLDWGWPGEVERRFTLTDYIVGRLERAVAFAGRPVVLAGYCMGGLLCTAFAARRPDLVAGLVLLATPWNFHACEASSLCTDPAVLARTLAVLEPGMALTGTLCVDALQLLFEALGPGAVAAKYRSFARADPDSVRALSFVAIEDWLSDGVPLAAPVARECLQGWYGANSPGRGEWRVAGLPVTPSALLVPSLVAVPTLDRIVPAASALALARQIPGSLCLHPAAGHVGMIVGSRAEHELWMPLRDWLRQLGC